MSESKVININMCCTGNNTLSCVVLEAIFPSGLIRREVGFGVGKEVTMLNVLNKFICEQIKCKTFELKITCNDTITHKGKPNENYFRKMLGIKNEKGEYIEPSQFVELGKAGKLGELPAEEFKAWANLIAAVKAYDNRLTWSGNVESVDVECLAPRAKKLLAEHKLATAAEAKEA